LDSVKPVPAPAVNRPRNMPRGRHSLSRNRPRFRRTVAAARSAGSSRKD
jgi:hypothetical protein